MTHVLKVGENVSAANYRVSGTYILEYDIHQICPGHVVNILYPANAIVNELLIWLNLLISHSNRFRFSFIELVARRLKIEKLNKQ